MIDRFFFFPQKNNELFSLLWKSSEVKWNINGQQLQGWFVKAQDYKKKPVVIYYGGNAEDISVQLRDLECPEKMSFLFINYRGFGESTGSPSEKNLFDDAIAIYDHLVNDHKIKPEKICLVGRSIGSSIAAYVASKKNVKKLVLVTPFDTIINVVPKMLRLFPINKLIQRLFTTTKYLENVEEKFLVLSAEADEVIPKKCISNLANKFQERLSLVSIDEANHQDINDYPEYRDAIESYIFASS